MLVRAFRLSDKLGNIFLKINIWLARQALGCADIFTTRARRWYARTWRTLSALSQRFQKTQSRITAGVQPRVGDAQTRAQKRSARAARLRQRSATEQLKGQVRALSVFAVVVLAALVGFILWSTGPSSRLRGGASLGQLPVLTTRVPQATLVPTPIPTATPVPDPLLVGGSIAYTMRSEGQSDIYAVVVGEGSPIQLTSDPADDRDPAWGPDGVHLAFASRRDGDWDIYVLDTTDGAITQLTNDPDFQGAPAWSPDGLWIVYESYKDQNLDIYILKVDGTEGPYRLTFDPSPDFEPAWSPDNRNIAYTSWRTGNQEIFVISLDNPNEQEAVNLSNTPDIDEDYAAWSPDGLHLAYSARDITGVEVVYVRTFNDLDRPPTLVAQGTQPSWAPNSGSVIFAAGPAARPRTHLIAGQFSGFGAATAVLSLPGAVSDPDWSGIVTGAQLFDWGGVPSRSEPLYEEDITYENLEGGPRYRPMFLNEVEAPNPYLSDRVDTSFNALRAACLSAIGSDFLRTLDDAWWPLDRRPEPGQTLHNWHYAGRAFALNRNLILGYPSPLEVVREETGAQTYWRVYVRAETQNGRLGEPLRRLPWDFEARNSGDMRTYNTGGAPKRAIPAGYYIDFTQLAHDYGWERVASDSTWVRNYGGVRFWQFVKTQGLSWEEAMIEVYPRHELDAFLGVPTPAAPVDAGNAP